jgi:hypothetical protein
VCVQAAETASEAVVLKVKGAATAAVPGIATPVNVEVGTKLPQGTVIETAKDAQVEIQVFPGIVSTIEGGSTADISKLTLTTSQGAVTKQSAVIGLKSGSVVSKLDPSKKGINDYSVSTPKGVAAARGTEFKVVLDVNGNLRISVNSGTVVVTSSITGKSVSVTGPASVTMDSVTGEFSEPTSGVSDATTGETTIKESTDSTIVVSPSAGS